MPGLLNFDTFLNVLQDEPKQRFVSHASQSSEEDAVKRVMYAPVGAYLIDYSLNTYTTVNGKLEAFAGCSAETFMQLGLPYTKKIFHPDDWNTYCFYAFPSMLNFLHTEARYKWEEFEFILNYRLKTANEFRDDGYTSIIQRSRHLNIIRNGLPYLSSGSIEHSNIPVSYNRMHLRIIYRNREVYQQTFISTSLSLHDLTPVEQKVLKYRSFGYSYDEISQMLDNAVGTVSNHLKNIKLKTNCFTLDELKILATQFGLV